MENTLLSSIVPYQVLPTKDSFIMIAGANGEQRRFTFNHKV